VVGAPDPEGIRGIVVKAYVVLSKGYKPSDALTKELQDYVKKVTAPYKYPRIIEYMDELQRPSQGRYLGESSETNNQPFLFLFHLKEILYQKHTESDDKGSFIFRDANLPSQSRQTISLANFRSLFISRTIFSESFPHWLLNLPSNLRSFPNS